MANNTERPGATRSPAWLRALRALGLTLMWFVLALLTLWAIAALYVDFRIAALRIPLTVIYVLAIIAILIKVKRQALGCRFVSRRLLHCAGVVAQPEAVERWRLASRRRPNRLGRDQRRSGHDPQPAQLRLPHRDRLHELLERPDGVSVATPLRGPFLHHLGTEVYRPPDSQLPVRGQRPYRVLHRGTL